MSSDLSLALTHAEKLVFCFANSQVTLSNVTFIGLILLASIELVMNLCARMAKKEATKVVVVVNPCMEIACGHRHLAYFPLWGSTYSRLWVGFAEKIQSGQRGQCNLYTASV